MNPVIAYEKSIYFNSKIHFLTSWITHEDNYLIWRYLYFLRREESAANKLTEYYWRRRKNDLGAKLGIIIYAGCCGKGLRIWHYGSTIISGDAKIGENCTFHGQACIGNDGSSTAAPVQAKTSARNTPSCQARPPAIKAKPTRIISSIPPDSMGISTFPIPCSAER